MLWHCSITYLWSGDVHTSNIYRKQQTSSNVEVPWGTEGKLEHGSMTMFYLEYKRSWSLRFWRNCDLGWWAWHSNITQGTMTCPPVRHAPFVAMCPWFHLQIELQNPIKIDKCTFLWNSSPKIAWWSYGAVPLSKWLIDISISSGTKPANRTETVGNTIVRGRSFVCTWTFSFGTTWFQSEFNLCHITTEQSHQNCSHD